MLTFAAQCQMWDSRWSSVHVSKLLKWDNIVDIWKAIYKKISYITNPFKYHCRFEVILKTEISEDILVDAQRRRQLEQGRKKMSVNEWVTAGIVRDQKARRGVHYKMTNNPVVYNNIYIVVYNIRIIYLVKGNVWPD